MVEIQALATSLWVSIWSWTRIPSHTSVSGLFGSWVWLQLRKQGPPRPRDRPLGGSKLSLHTRVHCGCLVWPWAPPALPVPGKRFPPGSSRRGLSWPRRRPHTQASCLVGMLDSYRSELLGPTPFHSQGLWGSGAWTQASAAHQD